MEGIVDLAIKRVHLTKFLKEMNAARIIRQGEPYIWDFCARSVQLSSRLALACAEEGKAYALVRAYRLGDPEKRLISFMQYVDAISIAIVINRLTL